MIQTSERAGNAPPPAAVRFDPPSDFYRMIKARVERYFQFTGLSPRDCARMYLKTSIIMAWLAASYVLLLVCPGAWYTAVPLAISMGLAIAGVGFNIQHDGGHKAYSQRPWLNRLAAMSIDLVGGSSYVWDHKHNTLHHTYANIAGHDDDIDLGILGRLSPEQKRRWFHRLQHLYLWVFYAFLPIKWQLYDDFYLVARGRIGPHRFARPRGGHLAVFIGGKMVFLFLAFVLPMMLHPVWSVIGLYLAASAVNGICLSVVFQLAHVVEEAEFPAPEPASGRMADDWAVHQLRTTVDFSRRNRVLTWFLGGLNFQVEHHLFPRICHVHYPRLSRIIEGACRKFGLKHNAHRSFMAGLVSHFRWLRRMGRATTAG